MSAITQSFSKKERICSDKQIELLFKEGNSFVCYPFRVLWKTTVPDYDPAVRIMVSVSKRKVRHAVNRNRIKRHVRESFRINKDVLYDQLPAGFGIDVAWLWVPNETFDYQRVERKMCEALKKIALQLKKTERHNESL